MNKLNFLSIVASSVSDNQTAQFLAPLASDFTLKLVPHNTSISPADAMIHALLSSQITSVAAIESVKLTRDDISLVLLYNYSAYHICPQMLNLLSNAAIKAQGEREEREKERGREREKETERKKMREGKAEKR